MARDRPFDPWQVPRNGRMMAVVEAVTSHLKLPRADRRDRYMATASAVICDAARHALRGEDQAISVSRSKAVLEAKSRYKAPALNGMLPGILDLLAAPETAILMQEKGERGLPYAGLKRTTIKAGERLQSLLRQHGVSAEDIRRGDGGEPIVLRASAERHDETGEDLEYDDTASTLRYRHEMQQINAWIAAADIEFDEAAASCSFIDTERRFLLRRFTRGDFESGGRLWHGFWQYLTKKQRAEGLVICGEETATIDFDQMGPRILYGMAGAEPPREDIYSFDGVGPDHRRGAKLLFNALLFDEGPRNRKPKGSGVGREKALPRDSYREIEAALHRAHPALVPFFGTGIGHRVQYRESELMVAALLRLRDLGVVALPVHDAVIVPRSRVDLTRQVLLETFREQTGIEGSVSVEG